MEIKRDELERRIASLKEQEQVLIAKVNGCKGSIQTYQAIIDMLDKPEIIKEA